MNRVRRLRALAALLASVLAPCAWADAAQACTPRVLAPLDAWLATNPWRAGSTHPEARVEAACKASPTHPSIAIVAAAYDRGAGGDKNVVVALVDPGAGRLRAVFTDIVQEDAAMRLGPHSLRIDTARYDLARGVRAFGVDVTTQATGPSCADGGYGPLRTLFVQEGASLRPVLASVVLSSWLRVSGPACAPSDGPGEAVIEDTATTIAVGPRSTNGLADLVLGGTIDRRPAARLRAVLHYDGRRYVAKDDRVWPDVIRPDAAASR